LIADKNSNKGELNQFKVEKMSAGITERACDYRSASYLFDYL